MTTQVRSYGPAVTGDSRTAGQAAKSRWIRHRWLVVIATAIVLAGIALILPAPSTSHQTYALDNPTGTGGRALAQVLGQQGIRIDSAIGPAQAGALAGQDSTLLVWGDYFQHSPQTLDALSGSDAGTVVLINPRAELLSAFTENIKLGTAGGVSEGVLDANCSFGAAVAAGTADMGNAGRFSADDGALTCFSGSNSTNGAVAIDVQPSRTVYVVADSTAFTNERITTAGHAALALGLLSSHDHLVWYLAVEDHLLTKPDQGDATMWDLLPSSAQMLALLLVIVAAVAALWRGRRLGPLITEDLPVEIRATETTEGLASLYRRSAASARALSALRAGAASRIAARIGVPRTGEPKELIAATARATSRTEAEVTKLLYGPLPTADLEIVKLAQELQLLENEVHKP